METEAKGWSVPTCSQEEPCRRGGGTLSAAGPRLCHPPGFRELAAPHASSRPQLQLPAGLGDRSGHEWCPPVPGNIPGRGLGRPDPCLTPPKGPISVRIRPSFQGAGRWAGPGSHKVLTAGLSSDTPRRHNTSPLSLTAQSAMPGPLPWAPGLSGMMDTSPRAMGATSSQGPLVTSLHFLCGRKRAKPRAP